MKAVTNVQDDKYYRVLGMVVKGSTLKKVKDHYFSTPPDELQRQVEQSFKEFEQERNRKKVPVSESLRLWITHDTIILADLHGKELKRYQTSGSIITDMLLEEVKRDCDKHIDKRGDARWPVMI